MLDVHEVILDESGDHSKAYCEIVDGLIAANPHIAFHFIDQTDLDPTNESSFRAFVKGLQAGIFYMVQMIVEDKFPYRKVEIEDAQEKVSCEKFSTKEN